MKNTRTEQLYNEFEKFHKNNPEVWQLFKKYTFQLINAGRANYSARAVFARIRWHKDIETQDSTGLKLNDHHSPYYSRMFHACYPEYDGFYRNRKLISLDKAASVNDLHYFDNGPPAGENALIEKLQLLGQ